MRHARCSALLVLLTVLAVGCQTNRAVSYGSVHDARHDSAHAVHIGHALGDIVAVAAIIGLEIAHAIFGHGHHGHVHFGHGHAYYRAGWYCH